LGSLLGLVLIGYGGTQAWLGNLSYDSALKRQYCAAWQCPQEFWENRTFAMLQESAGGASSAVLPQLLRALLLDAASAYAWANVAEVERDARQFQLAKYCFARALAAGPGNPAILFRAANFAFLTGDRGAVMQDLSAILRNPDLTDYYQPAFLTYSRLGAPTNELLEKGIPPVSTAAEAFLQFWMGENRLAEAGATWRWMVERSLTTENACGNYASFLVRNNDIAAAAQEWRRAYGKQAANYQVLNWIFNGGFEMEPRPGPFDWHIETTPDVEATRVQDVSRDGQWSVKLAFDGRSNSDYHGVYQEAAVSPGQWRVQVFFKLDNITSDQGIAVRVYDPRQASRLDVRTEEKTGTSEWTEVERAFVVDPQTKLVRVEIMRARSSTLDNKIAGRAWVDSLSLTPIH
jgi:tetratricopeptide (TPR) repeat protein